MITKKLMLAVFLVTAAIFSITMPACQKLDRPSLVLIPDPPPPPYDPLKSFFQFEGNAGDSGQSKLNSVANAVTFEEGVKGQAAKFGAGGYVSVPDAGDTIKNLGSFTIAYWINGTGPVDGGAQGLFGVAHKTEFWSNIDMFLENNNNAADPAEAFLKIHLFNAGVASGNGEEWNEFRIPGLLNGQWRHLALVYDAATSKITFYVDGVPDPNLNGKVLGGGNYGAVRFDQASGFVIGNFAFQTTPTLGSHGPEDWARPFAGKMDQFRIYNEPLTETEVMALVTNME